MRSLYFPANIIRIIKWDESMGHVAHMTQMGHTKFWSDNLSGTSDQQDLDKMLGNC